MLSLLTLYRINTYKFVGIIFYFGIFPKDVKNYCGITNISERAFKVAQLFHCQLSKLMHANGKPVAEIYCHTHFDNPLTQGPIVTFNILTQNENFVGYSVVSKMAAANNIHLRVGCFCNIGACQIHLGITTQQLIKNFQAGHVCGDEKDLIDGRPTGAVRISFGSGSAESDVKECIKFIQTCFVEKQLNQNSKDLSPVPRPPAVPLSRSAAVKTQQELEATTLGPKRGDASNSIPASHPMEFEANHFPIFSIKRTLSDLFVYPVKSCAGMKVKKWPINPSGLLHDREWMIVTERGIAVTQKSLPQLCLIQPTINLANNTINLNYPGILPLQLSLEFPSANSEAKNKDCISKVCFKKVHGIDCGQRASDWLSQALGEQGYRLFRIRPKNNQENKVTSLRNHGQYSLVTQPSLTSLFEKVHLSNCSESNDFEEFTSRFRSNFVIDGGVLFEEKSWKSIRIGSVDFINGKESSRCQMICINQTTTEKTSEPLATLFTLFGNKVNFGAYFDADHHFGEKIISVGDNVVITSMETGDENIL